MTRIPKDFIDGALYYVTVRGDHSEEIFKDKDDYRMYVQLLSKYKLQYGFKLFSFVLLSNHLHLLFELKAETSISDIMHDLNTNYTKYFNAKYQRKGHLFQERSRMVLAEKDKYLLPILGYMHLNPCYCVIAPSLPGQASEQCERSNLKEIASSSSAPRNDTYRLDAYPYSSHVLYASFLAPAGGEDKGEGIDLTEEINEVMKYLPIERHSDPDLERSEREGEESKKEILRLAVGRPQDDDTRNPIPETRKLYIDFINKVSQDEMSILGKELAKNLVLGSNDFAKKVEQKMEEKKTKPVDTVLLNEYENKTIKQRKFIMAGGVAVLTLTLFTIYLFASGLWLKEGFNQELTRKDSELNSRLARERKEIVQDLEEKHQADMVSYNAMARRLEIEKQRAKELEAKVDKSAVNGLRSTN